MITVKFFGMLRIDNKIKELQVPGGKVSEVMAQIRQSCPGLSEELLLQSVMFVNKKQLSGRRSLSLELKDGDELVLLSPACGG